MRKGKNMGINKHYTEIKAIKKNPIFPDTYFVSKYATSPYRACQHSCKYCDGRSERYYIKGDFEKDIVIRKNLPETMDVFLKKSRERGIISFSSGVSDPYQPIESHEKIMSRTLEVVNHHQYPVLIQTKSSMILRDVDILESINKHSRVIVNISLVHVDDENRSKIEPYASSVEARLRTISELKARGISVGVLAMPLLPLISDDKESIRDLFSKINKAGADYIMPGLLTLRPGIQKMTYMDMIKREFPQVYDGYKNLYSGNKSSGVPKHGYIKELYRTIGEQMKSHNCLDMMPHSIYKNQLTLYDELFVLLKHMLVLYDRKGVNTDPLSIGIKNYSKWLEENKRYFNRRRNLNASYLEEKLVSELTMGMMDGIIKNEKLIEFMKKILVERKTLDYRTLTIM